MISKPVISLRNVYKTFMLGDTEVHAVRGVSLDVPKKDYLVVLGPSGSGKSTMMNLIGALDIPTKGKILLDGRDISKMNESELAQVRGKKIGFVFQQFNLIPTLNAVQNVELPMIFYNVGKEERRERAVSLLNEVGLGERIYHHPSKLSGGEQQRVAIARALSNDPEVILADEPTGNLDSKTGEQIMSLLGQFHNRGKTVIMVTHDVELVKYAHRIIKLRDGKIIKEIMNKRELRAHEKDHD